MPPWRFKPPRRVSCAAWPARLRKPTRWRPNSVSRVFQSEDAKEGPKAFAEKRPPTLERSLIDPRSPCLIGVAQRTFRAEEGDAPEPLELWAEMAEAAARDSGGTGVVDCIDDVNVVYSVSWAYDDAPGRLAERLGLGRWRVATFRT